VEAERVRIKATAADVRDTILQGLLPAILNSVMQHELGNGLDDIRKWSKMAERYGRTEINSGKDISEIKSTLNDLATRLERTQLRAITPDRKSVQFNTAETTKSYSRDTSPVGPTRNFDPMTGQRLHSKPMFDAITGARLQDNDTSTQHQGNMMDRQSQARTRSPSPAYPYTERNNTSQNYQRDGRNVSSQRNNNRGGFRRDNHQTNRGGYNISNSSQRMGNNNITTATLSPITDRMTQRVTIVKADSKEDRHAEACSPTAGCLEMIGVGTKPVKGLKRLSLIQVIPTIITATTDAKHAQMKYHVRQVSAGQPK